MDKLTRKKRTAFRPSVTEASLEERLALSGTATAAADSTAGPLITQVMPITTPGVTPPPAAPPFNPGVTVVRAHHGLTAAHLRAAYARQVRAAMADLRSAIRNDARQLQANGSTPTAQQLADFNAMVSGALDATALRLTSAAALLPNAGSRLIPAIQNALLGSGSSSLTSRLSALAQSGRLSGSTGALQSAITQQINAASRQNVAQFNSFFSTTPLNRLSVNSSGQRIPLQQFMGGQLLTQLGNTLGTLAQNFPNVANAALFPNGATGTPSQAALNAFATQMSNALGTTAFQLGSALSLFPNSSNVTAQLQPMLFGAANSTNSLVSALQNLEFGSTGFNTAVSTAFNNAFQNFASPLGSFFGMTGQSNLALPTSGFTNPFGTQFSGSSFSNGFNNGFATGTNIGFIGFGQAPTAFNTNFGTGFNNAVTTLNGSMGFTPWNPANTSAAFGTGTSITSGGIGITPTSGGTGIIPTSGGTGVTPTSGGTGVTPTSGGTGINGGNP